MAGVSIDTTEIMALARDVAGASARIIPEAKKSLRESAKSVQKTMRSDMSASPSFGALAPAITFDITDSGAAIEAEVGVKKSKGGGSGRLDFGANIAYFGGAHGGGGVRDPRGALEDEAPGFFQALEDLAVKSVLG